MATPSRPVFVLSAWAGLALAASPALGAQLRGADDPAQYRGPATAQAFIGARTAVVAAGADRACVLSAPIPIAESAYREADGGETPFKRVRRSPAASVQIIAGARGVRAIRAQLKFPVDRDRPVTARLGDAAFDLAPFLEPSGDSLLIEPARVREALLDHWRAGGALTLTAASADSGRRVTDRLRIADLADLDACGAALAAGETPRLTPLRRLTVTLDLDLAEAPAVAEDKLAACGAADLPRPLRPARLRATTGFFAQTPRALVHLGRDGGAEVIYVPGVFKAVRRADGVYVADVSVAANANDPLAGNGVKGCLGDLSIELCRMGRGVATLDRCFGTIALAPPAAHAPIFDAPPPRLAAGGIGFASFGGAVGGVGGSSSDDIFDEIVEEDGDDRPEAGLEDQNPPPPEGAPTPIVIPLPAAGGLLLLAVALLALGRRRRVPA